MINSKEEMLYSAKELRKVLSSIENILKDYEGIDGNSNYVKYCYKKSLEAHSVDENLEKMFQDSYAADLSKRRGINIATLTHIIEKLFKLLDDIDTASDIFKPNWCKITNAVDKLQQLRWIYCTVENCTNEEGSMIINGEIFKKEDRIVLSIV